MLFSVPVATGCRTPAVATPGTAPRPLGPTPRSRGRCNYLPNDKAAETQQARPPALFPPWSPDSAGEVLERANAPAPAPAPVPSTRAAAKATGPDTATLDLPPYAYGTPDVPYQCLDSAQSLYARVVDVSPDAGNPTGAAVVRLECLNGREFLARVRSTTAYIPLKLYDNEVRGYYEHAPANGDGGSNGNGNGVGKVMSDAQKYLRVGYYVLTTGVAFETGVFDASNVYLLYNFEKDGSGTFVFESPDWYRDQICQVTDGWLRHIFGSSPDGISQVEWSKYRTNLGITYDDQGQPEQEVATLSRLIYGLSSAFHLTGNERFLDAAKAGLEYQRRNFKLTDPSGGMAFWTSARDGGVFKITPPDGDDANSIPLYEQIYALAGLAQYYRITNCPMAFQDIKETVAAFKACYYDDPAKGGSGGFFSHIDYATKSPFAPLLGQNTARKNWNSVGDHIPAYLINTLLALENAEHGVEDFRSDVMDIMLACSRLVVDKFIGSALKKSAPHLVCERFFRDWTEDTSYSWQQNRGIIGHNCKIVWNMLRVAHLAEVRGISPEHGIDREACKKLLEYLIKEGGIDGFRGGCMDAVERSPANGVNMEYPWMNTKDFWQQEQRVDDWGLRDTVGGRVPYGT